MLPFPERSRAGKRRFETWRTKTKRYALRSSLLPLLTSSSLLPSLPIASSWYRPALVCTCTIAYCGTFEYHVKIEPHPYRVKLRCNHVTARIQDTHGRLFLELAKSVRGFLQRVQFSPPSLSPALGLGPCFDLHQSVRSRQPLSTIFSKPLFAETIAVSFSVLKEMHGVPDREPATCQ